MGKVLKLIGGIVAFIIIVPVLLLVGLYVTVDFDGLKKDITQKASTSLGRDIALNGPIGIGFEHGIALSVKDVSIGNPAGFKDKEFLKAGKISVALNWKALADHKIDVQQFVIEDANINLISNAAGENNWELKIPKSAEEKPAATTSVPASNDKAKPAQTADVPSNFKIERVDLNSIEILNTTLHQKDEYNGKSQDLEIKKATINAPSNAALNVGAQGSYNKAPFTVEFNAPGGIQELSEGKPTQIDLKADYAGQSYAVKGTYARVAKTQSIKNLIAKVMGIDVTGNITANMEGGVPSVTGNLSAQEVNLSSLNKDAQKSVQKKIRPAIQSLVLVNKQLANAIVASAPTPDFKALRAVNAEIALTVGKLIFAEGKAIENFKTNINLAGGRLRLDAISANFLNVAYKGLLDFNPTGSVPVTRVVLNGNNIDFVALAAAFNSKSPLAANGDLNVDVSGQGLTPDSFKNTLSGKIEMIAGKGAIDMGNSGAAGINLIKMLYPKTQASEKQNINCGVLRFNADNGVLKSNGILFDSPLAAVSGEGNVDLVHDNANLLFRHAVKDQQAGSFLNVPIKATGPLAKLTFAPEESAVTEKVMSAINGGGSTSTGVPRVDPNAKGNGCVATLNDPHPVMLEQMKTQDAAKATINQAKDVIKSIGKPSQALDKLKGLFGH
ncbi:MAG: AsmA family protein [Alphaproteobacteria bacterium]|nr:AsmA family protein [Alphaproteobacteria bacterium]